MFEDLFITDEQRVTIDLHDMELLEATYHLEKLFETLPEDILKKLLLFTDIIKDRFY